MSDYWFQQRYDDAVFALHRRNPGTRAAGDAPSIGEVVARLRDLIDRIPDSTHATCDKADLRAVLAAVADRDAAVARHLAEAGAVHPAVHTPNRVMQWLGEHGWQAETPAYKHPWTAGWRHPYGGIVHVVQAPECPDYVGWTGIVVRGGAAEAGLTVQQVLMEIAQMPEEVAW